MNMVNKSKIIYRLILFTISTFLVWNMIWATNYHAYSKLTTSYKKYHKCMGKKIENYNYTLKCPDYFSLTGNFAISNDNDTLSIIIWPDLFIRGNYKFGLMIFDEQLNHGYMFYVDKQLNYLDIPENDFSNEEIKIINENLKKNSEELKKMNRLANEEWGFD